MPTAHRRPLSQQYDPRHRLQSLGLPLYSLRIVGKLMRRLILVFAMHESCKTLALSAGAGCSLAAGLACSAGLFVRCDVVVTRALGLLVLYLYEPISFKRVWFVGCCLYCDLERFA